MDKKITVLLTCCLGDYMSGTIRAYRAGPLGNRLRIVGTDMNEMPYNFDGIDAFYRTGRCVDKDYLPDLLRICKKERVDVLIPFHTNELEPLSKNREEFQKECGTTVLVSNIEGLTIANDKALVYEFFRKNEIPVPATLITTLATDAGAFLLQNKGRPFVLKERHNCGGRGFMRIDSDTSAETLTEMFRDGSERLVQEYLPGEEFTVDCLVDQGKVLTAVCKMNSLMENGVARMSTVVDNPYCVEVCSRVCSLLKLHGSIGFDLKRDVSGVPIIIDVNPRITATVSLVAAAGVNIPSMALEMALGMELEIPAAPRYGVSLIRRVADNFFDEEMNPLD